jgi:hypothetical protein
MPAAVIKVPSSTLRRDAGKRISAGAAKEGAIGDRMRFGSGFAQFTTGRRP